MDIKLKDIKNITLEQAGEFYNNLGFAFNIKDGNLKGVILEGGKR